MAKDNKKSSDDIDSKIEKEKKLSIFYPKSRRSIVTDYPELKDHLSYGRDLNRSEMLFVWYYACKASPIFDLEIDEVRCEKAIKLSFDAPAWGTKLDYKSRRKMLSLDFTHKIATTIEEMKRFEPNARYRIRSMMEKMVANIENIVDIDPADLSDEDGGRDISKERTYIETCAKATSTLPVLLKQIEGLGVSEVDEKEMNLETEGLIDDWHENET